MATPKAYAKPGQMMSIAPGLRRILAPNPSPMTYLGTNTYLLGTRDIAVIDPGPPDDAHLAAILGALEGHQRISHVVVTHSHIDHSPLAMVLAQITGVPVYAFGASSAGRSDVMAHFANIGGGEGVDETFMPDKPVADGQTLHGSDWTLEALHTPGHMGNHLCFHWPEGRGLFSGDLVMGWASSMVSPPDGHLTDFMASLHRLARRAQDTVYYPGHGETVTAPQDRVAELLAHRTMRSDQILAALRNAPLTAEGLTHAIYTDVDPRLWPAAERNVLAHLIDLTEAGKVRATDTLSLVSRFEAI